MINFSGGGSAVAAKQPPGLIKIRKRGKQYDELESNRNNIP